MSTVTVPTAAERSAAPSSVPPKSRRWIINARVDQFLILLTPLLAIPTVLLLNSPALGVNAQTISIVVTAFFATGHHLPGLIRAYGDPELFDRFRWRFLLAPPLVFLAYFPLYTYHFELFRLIILVWATWHGLMQLYGFVRIYDGKVGSVSRATANWDWLVCLCGFVAPQMLRPELLSEFLNHWYTFGGLWISPAVVQWARQVCLAVSVVAVFGFSVNYILQLRSGRPPNPLKLLMLVSGIGTWWFAMCYVENLLLGVALFDICHDVQYLAIVWLYNCRRVDASPQLGRFMRYVFRRGMVLLYVGLIVAYGAIGLVGPMAANRTVSQVFYGLLFTSTILHYYYDGFIWKVRESTNRQSLGLAVDGAASAPRRLWGGGLNHLLKWAPAVIVLGVLFTDDLRDAPLTAEERTDLEKTYAQSLMGRHELPPGEKQQSWLYQQFEQRQQIVAAVPDDRASQLRMATMLANFGRYDEAEPRVEKIVAEHPDYWEARSTLGGIYLVRGRLDEANSIFEWALAHSRTPRERSTANLMLGQVAIARHNPTEASARFQAALDDNPQLSTQVEALRKSGGATGGAR
ncbi:MAG: tetratricopeptide repeat protein [Planctomycetaceae bacterium]